MTRRTEPKLETGRVYRTQDLAEWGANTPRLAKRLVKQGILEPLAHGLYFYPKRGRFGPVPPNDQELMRSFLRGAPFVFTGPDRWNALGLGSTALFSLPLVYNTKRSGTFTFGGRKFLLRRVEFPENPPPEWFVIDLLEHTGQAGVSKSEVASALLEAVSDNRFNSKRLWEMALRYGSRNTQQLIESTQPSSVAA